ncbi:MAG: hypothetical protein GX907_03930 [Clostridiaceae bacterium]|nr:hypothetical protein [Clostridiaceae bacterium]
MSTQPRRIIAVHDLSGYGSGSMTTVLPVLAAAGFEVCPLPVAVLSAHTGVPGFTYQDLNSIWSEWLAHWRATLDRVDYIYTGFLSAPGQIKQVLDFAAAHPEAMLIVDPVMGDHGEIYPTYTPELCDAMAALTAHAELLLPNLTEGCRLVNLPYPASERPNWPFIRLLLTKLHRAGARQIVLKGISLHPADLPPELASRAKHRGEHLSNFIVGKDANLTVITHPRLPISVDGSGDFFAANVIAKLYGPTAPTPSVGSNDSAKRLTASVLYAIRLTMTALRQTAPEREEYGLDFIPVWSNVLQTQSDSALFPDEDITITHIRDFTCE